MSKELKEASYRQTVLTAFQEVEDNLAALRILSHELDQQNEAVGGWNQSQLPTPKQLVK